MKILVWNCKMGFSEKRRFVRHLCPDIAVIPECSQNSIQAPAGDQLNAAVLQRTQSAQRMIVGERKEFPNLLVVQHGLEKLNSLSYGKFS